MAMYESRSAGETYALGQSLGRGAVPGGIYCLQGDLGAGKTVLAQGFASGLGVEEPVDSPTFTILKEYAGRMPLYHFDAYRIEEPEEFAEIGFEEFFFGDGVCLIEWPEQILPLIPEEACWIRIEKNPELGGDYRKIIVVPAGSRKENCV